MDSEEQDLEIVASLLQSKGFHARVDVNQEDELFILVALQPLQGPEGDVGVGMRLSGSILNTGWLRCSNFNFELADPTSLDDLHERLERCDGYDQSCEKDGERCPHCYWDEPVAPSLRDKDAEQLAEA
jgi:hypothetical protein